MVQFAIAAILSLKRLLAEALAARKGLAPDDIACRVVAGTAVSIMKLSLDAWLVDPDAPAETFARAAFAALRQAAR